MDKEGFRQLLLERNIPEALIAQHITIAERFEESVGEARPATTEDFSAFSAQLAVEGLDTYESYLGLARYGRFVRNNAVFLAALELLDGAEVMGVLHEKLAQALGEQKRDEIFRGLELPSIGTPSREKARLMRVVMERLEASEDPATIRGILSGCLRQLDDRQYLAEREKYLESGSVDAYLQRRGQEFIAQLEQIKEEGTLFFNEEITDEVIDYVRRHPEIREGVRVGGTLYAAKIPYMAREYLAETDERMKRYYYCHCPWARESLRAGEVTVSPIFCNCSAGFEKKMWEVIFDQPLEAEVVESVLQGDLWCKFAIHLPADL